MRKFACYYNNLSRFGGGFHLPLRTPLLGIIKCEFNPCTLPERGRAGSPLSKNFGNVHTPRNVEGGKNVNEKERILDVCSETLTPDAMFRAKLIISPILCLQFPAYFDNSLIHHRLLTCTE